MVEIEICCTCGEPTGHAGKGEDSLFSDEVGPLCESCFDAAETMRIEYEKGEGY